MSTPRHGSTPNAKPVLRSPAMGRRHRPVRAAASPVDPAIHREVAVRLADSQQRYTALRRELVHVLARAGRPLTMPEILGTSPGLSQSTAYRNVAALIEVGAIRRVAWNDDHGRFELAEELAGHHHHLVCTTCGTARDVVPSPRLERALREAVTAAAGDSFTVTEHRFELFGTCADCR